MTSINPLMALVAALFGAFTWTFLEYVIHRYAGHEHPRGNPFGTEHLRHHATTHYFSPTWKKAVVATPVIGILALVLSRFMNWPLALAYAGGLAAMYVSYEVTHRRAHTHGPRGRYGRWLRRHHFHHHFRSPKHNHGVTSPLWDYVFGTYQQPGVIRVPEKHAMVWLINPATGEIWPELAGDYAIARRGDKTAVR